MSLNGRSPRVVAKSRTMIGGLRWMTFTPPSSVIVAVCAEGVTGNIGLPGPVATAVAGALGATAAGRGRGGEKGADAVGGRLGEPVGPGEPGAREAGGVNAVTGGRKGAEATEGVGAGALGGRRPGVTKGAFGRGALKGALGPVVADAGWEIEGTAGGREIDGVADTGKGGRAAGRETAMPGAGGAGGREAEAFSVGEVEGSFALA